MTSITLSPIRKVSGDVFLPGSKSLSNRGLLLSSLADGTTRLTNLLRSDDTSHMIEALRQLGTTIKLDENGIEAEVTGKGDLFEPPANKQFFLGNAGTAIRPLTCLLALMEGVFEIDGDEYMRERPIEHLVDALEQLGAEVHYLERHGCPPLRIIGGQTRGGKVIIPGNISSQFLTSLLMSLPLASQGSTIEVLGEQVSKPYLDITLGIMGKFGVTASHQDYQMFQVPGGQQYQSPGSYMIEGDASSASYFFGAAAIAGSVRVLGLGKDSVQGDLAFIDVMERMGARVVRNSDSIEVHRGSLRGVDVDLNHIPDAAMTVATVALFAEGPTIIRNIYNWRVKETDRMHAMATGLRKLGAGVKTGDDYIVIDPPEDLNAVDIDTFGDHRVAMSFSLAAMGNQPIQINDPECTRKTFPDYFDVLESISG
ncbi:MAG: 3-phosphoshikimate 1-carboxyvinyltransferase [Gammaproteobacteria bacterium]|nr:3-phosphoshikimate 1-carboxyvinyltransferase [Gammaproteobacteria bacterium]|tara:strand:+ start:4428 stop:5705 length:1278 start_codon:yes stop_codon:yes gene_type:complete